MITQIAWAPSDFTARILPYRARDIGTYVGTCRERRSRFGPDSP